MTLPTKSMPSSITRAAAAAVEGAWRLLRIERTPPLTRFAIDMLSSSVTVSIARASRELGYAPIISVEEGLAELARTNG